ncbi:MAG: GNAT family N-acetyltransferase [Candidatus Pacearchaeota archaeon]
MELKTERFKLRELREGDEKDLVENANDIEVSIYTATMPHPYTEEEAKNFISRSIKKSNEDPRNTYNFAIEHKGKLAGGIGITNVDTWKKTCDLGYWIGKAYWSKGLMKEAIEAALNFAFGELRLNRINANVVIENKPSINLLEKFGFKREGRRRQSERPKSTGELHDDYVYGLLKEDWKK